MWILYVICAVIEAGIMYLIAQRSLKKIKAIEQEYAKITSMLDKETLLVEQAKSQYSKLIEDTSSLSSQIASLEEKKIKATSEYDKILASIEESERTFERNQDLSRNAFGKYFETIEEAYAKAEQELEANHKTEIANLKAGYNEVKAGIIKEYDKNQAALEDLKKTRTAAIQAFLKEQEIKQQQDFYCLRLTSAELNDIRLIESIRPSISQGHDRTIRTLVWSNYFQSKMTDLCNRILGNKTVTGIYKITNQTNGLCYIGQSVDVSTRWKRHAKAGLGIDTPAKNQLYKAMMEEGIWNFSWELLETCTADQLNEKERMYIDLYDSYTYGYNATRGNS